MLVIDNAGAVEMVQQVRIFRVFRLGFWSMRFTRLPRTRPPLQMDPLNLGAASKQRSSGPDEADPPSCDPPVHYLGQARTCGHVSRLLDRRAGRGGLPPSRRFFSVVAIHTAVAFRIASQRGARAEVR